MNSVINLCSFENFKLPYQISLLSMLKSKHDTYMDIYIIFYLASSLVYVH